MAGGSAAQLAHQVSGKAEVRFTHDGRRHADSVEDATGYVRGLFARHGAAIDDLEVRRARLQDVYLTMVREFESGQRSAAQSAWREVSP